MNSLSRKNRGLTPVLATLAVMLLGGEAGAENPPPYSDTAGTVFDIITRSDPSALACLEPRDRGARQIWDKRVDGEPVVEAHLFRAHYSDGAVIEIAINPEFAAPEARAQAERFARPLGQLPSRLREGIARFSVHDGHKGFHAGTGQIVVYAGTASQREGYDHLEESLFHEAVHASWDEAHRLSGDWRAAQAADGGFLTGYAARSPEREDLAETALFGFAIQHFPDRFPPVDTQLVRDTVPNRLAYIAGLLPPDQPLMDPPRPVSACP